jgi:hypothetical protein
VMVRIPDDMPLVSREILGRGHVVRARVEELCAARDWIERQTAFLGTRDGSAESGPRAGI